MRTRVFSSAIIAAVLALGVTGCGSDKGGTTASGASVVKAGTLTVCSDVPYPPFEDFDSSAPSGFTGFDIDLVQKIADGLKLKLTVKDSSFDGLQSGLSLNSGACDLVASAMTITDDRAKNLDFSDGYYDSEQSLLVPAGSSITSIADLAGKKVGVQQGTTGKTYTQDNAPDADIISFPSDAEMYAAIKANQVDALLQDLPVNLDHQNDAKQAGKFKVVETYKTDEQYGFAIKKGNTDLVNDVNDQLTKLRDDGTYKKIYDTYFSTN